MDEHTPYILVVEDEEHIGAMLQFNLQQNQFTVQVAQTAQQAEFLCHQKKPDLILLDWMLPEKSGVAFLKELKQAKHTRDIPVIMLTAKAEEANKLKGLATGADDYVTKPFSPKELIARIRAILKRGPLLAPNNTIQIGELSLDIHTHQVRYLNQVIKLTPNEYKLLYYFMRHKNKVLNRQQLLDNIWGHTADIDERTIDVLIKRLRKSLAIYGIEDLIVTVRGFGYKLYYETKTNAHRY